MGLLYILSNSPGELSGWVEPVTRAVAARRPEQRAVAVLLPCPYASGREGAQALTMPGVARVMTFRRAMRSAKEPGRSLVLQLGGDPMYGWVLSARLRLPWMIYTSRPRWRGKVSRYFIPDGAALARFKRAGVDERRCAVVGNLILDSVKRPCGRELAAARERYGAGRSDMVAFLPGSRPFEYKPGFGFFCECAARLRARCPDWQAVLPVAPTVSEDILRSGLQKSGLEWRGGERVKEIILKDGSAVPLVREGQHAAIAASSLAVAFPGTNNLQIAALGVPLLMIAPLNWAQKIPLDGLPGALPHKYRAVASFKKKLVHFYNDRHEFVSLPNMLAGRALLPEHRELMTSESACRYIAELMESPEHRRAIKESYAALDLRGGAADRIAADLCRCLDGEEL